MAAKTVHAYTGAGYVLVTPRSASASALKRLFSPFATNIWEGFANAVTSVAGSNTATGTFPNKTSNVTVSWSNPADTALTSYYDIYYDVASSGTFTKHNSTAVSKSSTSYTFGAIPAATNYRWFVRAISISGLATDSAISSVFSLAAPASRPLTANTAVLTNGVSWTATAGVYQRFYLYYSSNNVSWTGPLEVASSISQTLYEYQISTAEYVNRYWRVTGQNTNAHWSPEATATVLTPVDCRNLGNDTNGFVAGTPVANAATGTCGNRVYTTTTTWTKTSPGGGCSSYTTTSGNLPAPSCGDSCYDETNNPGTTGCGCSGSQTTNYVSYTAKTDSNCGAKANSGTSYGSCTGDCLKTDTDCYTQSAVDCDGCGSATYYTRVPGSAYGGAYCPLTGSTGACGTWQEVSWAMFGSYLENFLGDGVNWETTIGCSGWIPSNDYWCYYPGSGSVTQWQLYQCSNTGARKAVRRAWDTCCIPSCC
jgi:hypothetical protein